MPGACSICLASFKEPQRPKFVTSLVRLSVSVDHLPQLTYLPKKYHEYVLPSLRRVYLDSQRDSELKSDLKAAKEKIKKLEKDRDILMQQCEKHMAAAQAQAEGERTARLKASDLQSKLDIMRKDSRVADVKAEKAVNNLKCDIDAARAGYRGLEKAYEDLRRRYEKLRARQDQIYASTSTVSSAKEHHRDPLSKSETIYMSLFNPAHRKVAREVRPPRASKPKARPASPPVHANKRQKLVPGNGQTLN
ncbi:hypothetical protein C0993_004086 [Termitomyces sp. T159_Od127]|nr:hypothetical protein C0993_004086 [Termitomyces sp. T159_Od127]